MKFEVVVHRSPLRWRSMKGDKSSFGGREGVEGEVGREVDDGWGRLFDVC